MANTPRTTLSAGDHTVAAERLVATDHLLRTVYPGDTGTRQPLHTVYIPGNQYRAGLTRQWGQRARDIVEAAGGYGALVETLEIPVSDRDVVVERVREKLSHEPIEDLRIDFEDGYGSPEDATEDADVLNAVNALLTDLQTGAAPPYIGIRFKCFEAETRQRGIRTLDLFLTELVSALGPEGLPPGLRLTLPKVTTVEQVEVMVFLLNRLEEKLNLPHKALNFEVQVETPQVIIGADGTHPISRILIQGEGRICGLHYGTYDYSASLGITAAHQSLEHPAADFAKNIMQVASAGTGVRLCDGSTNIIPATDSASPLATWRLHGALVTRSLQRAYYQGWDLHPAHLPSRFAASYAFLRHGVDEASLRLRNYVENNTEGFLDEPATARPLAAFLARGLQAGAMTAEELHERVGIEESLLFSIAYPTRSSP